MGAPKPATARNCPQSLWVLENQPCLYRVLDDGTEERRCPGDLNYPEDIAGITVEGYNCERNYQSTLIRQCKKWLK